MELFFNASKSRRLDKLDVVKNVDVADAELADHARNEESNAFDVFGNDRVGVFFPQYFADDLRAPGIPRIANMKKQPSPKRLGADIAVEKKVRREKAQDTDTVVFFHLRIRVISVLGPGGDNQNLVPGIPQTAHSHLRHPLRPAAGQRRLEARKQ